MAQTVNCVLIVLSMTVLYVNAGALIGSCDKDQISTIMNKNADHCPENLLHQVYKHSPTVVFRVFNKAIADKARCVLGHLQEPVNNVFDFITTAYFWDESLPIVNTTYVMVESKCGMIYKHIVEENYSTYKIIISYFDGLTLGYYGCSDDATADDVKYVVCLSVMNEDEDTITASVGQCKQHMIAVTGSTDLVDMDVNECH